jgi:hypothetical protein
MIPLAIDENFNNDILRALLRRCPSLDFIRIQDVGLRGAKDEDVLDWAARECRVLVTHDVSTITAHAYERVKAGQKMPGVLEAPRSAPLAIVIEDLQLIAECSEPSDWEGQVRYLPLR